MGRREIEVDEVSVQNGLLVAKTNPTNPTTGGGALVGGAIGAAVAGPAGLILGVLLGAGAGAGKPGEEKMIPLSRVAEITKNSSGKTRVVIDD